MAYKDCTICGSSFWSKGTPGTVTYDRRKTCSKACFGESERRKPKVKHLLPCRVCGQATKYGGTETSRLFGMVHCGLPECALESRNRKNAAIADRAIGMYRDGSRQKLKSTWDNVRLVSPEEDLLAPWFESIGWVRQHKVLTLVHTNKLPRMFRLDFACPDRLLYVEIDGHVHRLRRDRDARRDAMLGGLGWRGLRITSRRVRDDLQLVKQDICAWLDQLTPTTN